jgi:hypothetical protein
MWLLENKKVTSILKVSGIVLWPFIFVNDKHDRILVNHERIHEHQIKDCGVLKFYILYLWYHFKFGYWENPFEIEAFENHSNLEYLTNRIKRKWNFL